MESPLPSRHQLVLPLLGALYDHGPLTPAAAVPIVADRLGLSTAAREATITFRLKHGVRVENALRYNLRWVRQEIAADELLDGSLRGLWAFTNKGREFYVRAKPGVVISVFENNLGTALCADVRTLLQAVDDGFIQTYITSPEYPIACRRPYGGLTPREAIAFVDTLFRSLRPKLAEDANVFLNLGYVFNEGTSTQSTYVERIVAALEDQGYHLQQRLFWHNPTKPPAGDAVTNPAVRTHLTEKIEPVYRFSPNRSARGDSRKILKEYSTTQRANLKRGGDPYGKRPSGHGHNGSSFARDNGGAIPGNLFSIPHETYQSASYRALARHGLPPHPAQMPEKLIEPLVRLTTDPGDVVADLQGGGGSVARVCERLGRRWLYNDIHLNYAANASVHFENTPGFTRLVDPVTLQACFR